MTSYINDRGKKPVASPVPLADGGTGTVLADPGADRIMFWDDSAGQVTWLTAGDGLTITDTTITASGQTYLQMAEEALMLRLYGRKDASGWALITY